MVYVFCDAFEPDLLGGRCNRRGTAWHNGDTVSAVFIFPEGKEPPEFIQYLGKVLPYAVIGLLVIYCSVSAVELYFICCWCSLYFASNTIKVRQNLVAKPDESDILNA